MQVQQEDIALCEAVQRGLRSPAYDAGRCEDCSNRTNALLKPQLRSYCHSAQILLWLLLGTGRVPEAFGAQMSWVGDGM